MYISYIKYEKYYNLLKVENLKQNLKIDQCVKTNRENFRFFSRISEESGKD